MKKAFISHISEDAKVASALKEALQRDFLGMLDMFVSSDSESITAGEPWLQAVEEALENCAMLLVLCSPDSVGRPWINFETGAAWMRKVPLIPICHSGLLPEDLKVPLSLRQAIKIDNPDHLRRLYNRIAALIPCNLPEKNFEKLAVKLAELKKTAKEPESLGKDRAVRLRLQQALNHPRQKWRTLKTIATEAAVSTEEAGDMLRADESVRFSKGKSQNLIVGLKSRVGQTSF